MSASSSTRQTLLRRRRGRVNWVAPLLVLLIAIAIAYLVSYLVLEPSRQFLLPPPHQVIAVFFDPATLSDIAVGLSRTALVAALGLAAAIIIGMAWAIAMSQARWVEDSLFPYAVILQCIPILALVPLIGFWFGYDLPARIVVCVMISLFPIVSNTLFGLRSTDPGQRDLFLLEKSSRWGRLWRLELPAAMPAVFAGLRIAAGLTIVGAIVGDFFFSRGTPGLGSLISTYQSRLQSPQLFAAIIAASLFGVLVFFAFGWLGRRVVGHWYDF
ncbi:ABC transporter permease [Herbiconiux ginsengi]|uniref:NitT/TauT family transport system permease protein n=1 Tax=Herbiconiux ginsengi TaxID=381665 RepID=A0A1H3S0Z7_9MICO|nr:ABC transporter permease [Herbiconiux ginsengi]SDZ31457.1 NitT/TauT family transport system permease protein [Herbiconiux ginsengi]